MKKHKIIAEFILIILFLIISSKLLQVNANIEEKSKPLEEGIYQISTALNENYVIDISQASKDNYANVQIYTNNYVDQQRFKIKYIGDGYYTITALHSNKLLNIAYGEKKPRANIWQFEDDGTDSEKWIIKDAGNGYYNIISKLSGLYLDVADGNAKDGANIQVYTKNDDNKNAQKFKFVRVEEETKGEKTIEEGTYQISTALNENYVLDISQASKNNYANVQIYTNNYVDQQRFKIKYLGDGCYTITAVHSNKLLNVAYGEKKSGANIWQFEDDGTDSERWIIKDAGNGYYNIISKLSGLYLDVSGGEAKNEANIQIYTNNDTNAQKFKFINIEKTEEITGTKTIEEGVYQISTALNEKYVIDISQASKDNYANVQIYENNYVNQQKFKIKYLENGLYTIQAIDSNKMIEIANGAKEPRTNVWQNEEEETDAQKWIIKDAGNGYYNIISKLSGLYLDVADGNAKNEANIQVYTKNDDNQNAQKFKFSKTSVAISGTKTIEEGIYQISTALNEKYVIDISQASKDDRANVQLYSNNNVKQQKFKIKYFEDGSYTITALHSKKVLDVADGSKVSGANVWQYSYNGTDAQKWIIKEAENGYYNIISKASGLYLDVSNGEAKDGANIYIYLENNTEAQKFTFEKIDTTINIDEAKYPGYKEKVEALKEAHPDWNFEFLYTGLKFSDAVAGEAAVHSRNLVPTSYSGEWICSVCGTKLYDSGWYCASEKAIAYYLDPRNFLDEVNIFQFQDVNEYLDEACTIEGIRNQVDGTFLQNYANDIETACRNTNTNPYYIIARLFQEQGRSGTTIGKGMDGGDGKTYYNPFNIGANGDGGNTIYANALARAKREGWDSMEKAIEGGIGFCKANWLDNYQNTLYQNRFDIDSTNGTSLYTHQYMQNLMGAYSEARILQSMYNNTNKLDSSFTFIIPVYEKMDAEISKMPSNTTESYPINVETTGTSVRLREEANENSKIIMEFAEKGTVLLSIERGVNSDWQKVVLQDGTIGYVSGKYLRQINDVTTCNYTAKVKTNDGDGCNIRIGPGVKASKLGALADGEQVTVIDNSTYKNIDGFDWYRIIIPDGRQAFMPGKYLK